MYKITSQLSLCGEPIDDAQMIDDSIYILCCQYYIGSSILKHAIHKIFKSHVNIITYTRAKWKIMENDLLKCFPCRVTQHTYQRRGANLKDRREDRSWRKKIKYHCKRKLDKHVSDPLHNYYKNVVLQNLHPHFTRYTTSNMTHTPQI